MIKKILIVVSVLFLLFLITAAIMSFRLSSMISRQEDKEELQYLINNMNNSK